MSGQGSDPIVVLVTAANGEESTRLADMLVGAHLGYPWLDEVVALLRKYPNFHVMTSGWAPSRVPPEVWDCAKRLSGGGRLIIKDAIMFGGAIVTMADSARAYLRRSK